MTPAYHDSYGAVCRRPTEEPPPLSQVVVHKGSGTIPNVVSPGGGGQPARAVTTSAVVARYDSSE
jgi:hypothetical protein